MGLGPFRSSDEDWGYWNDAKTPRVDPFKCSLLRSSYSHEQNCTVVKLKYDDYDRLMVISGRWGGYASFDPHFKENERILARFPATDVGYDNALAFVAFMNGGECHFDQVPIKGVKVVPPEDAIR